MNVIDLLSTATLKFQMSSTVPTGHIEKNQDIMIKKLSCYKTGLQEIDTLDRRKREFLAEKILTELKKEIRQANKKSSIILKEVDILLTDIVNKIYKDANSYHYKREIFKFSF
jgi:hypothetical protein